MTAEERREKGRLRSERWRRAHGIMPRRKAARPWLAEGISRSTWYRRRKQARERQALTLVATAREAVCDRLDWQLARLRRELETRAVHGRRGGDHRRAGRDGKRCKVPVVGQLECLQRGGKRSFAKAA